MSLEYNYWDGESASTAVSNSSYVPTYTGINGGTFDEDVITALETYYYKGYVTWDNGYVTWTVVPAHTWDDGVWTWTEDGSGYTASVTFTCTENSAHTYTYTSSDGTVTVTSTTTAATCTAAGSTVCTASAADPDGNTVTDTKTVAISAAGHTWGAEPAESWKETADGYIVTITYSCTKCDETLTVTQTVAYNTDTSTGTDSDSGAGYTTTSETLTDENGDTYTVYTTVITVGSVSYTSLYTAAYSVEEGTDQTISAGDSLTVTGSGTAGQLSGLMICGTRLHHGRAGIRPASSRGRAPSRSHPRSPF